jgi:thiol-disulfide isomerase/thioredoxin
MDAGRFDSALALVYLKTGRPAAADSAMDRALEHLSGDAEPQPVDWLRAGLVDETMGRPQRAWERISKALLLDSSVEAQDPYYLEALTPIVTTRSGGTQSVSDYLAQWRRQNAQAAPDLRLVGPDGKPFWLSQKRGHAVLVDFFSPACSSCQMEIPAVRELWQSSLADDSVEVLFVLNNPSLADDVPELFARAGIEAPDVVTLAEGSAYDYIVGEPTVWIVDVDGRLQGRHTGYADGDETIYARELAAASEPTKACNCQAH